MSNYQWIWQYVKKYANKGFLAIIFLIINALLIVVNPLVAGEIVDKVIEKGEANLLIPLLALMIGITIFRTIIRYTYQILFERIGQNSLFELRQEMYQKLQELDFDFFNHTRVGDIMVE